MNENPQATIRKFQPGDREDVRRICCSSAFLGSPSSLFFEGDEIFADAITLYFTDYEPESCFVAEYQGKVVGYIIGAKDVSRARRKDILFKLLKKAITSAVLFKPRNMLFIWHCLVSLLKGEFSEPDFSRDYPATLHINIQEGFRGSDIGTGLIAAYLKYLKEEGVRGVHLATLSERAGNFFTQQGFDLLYKGRRTYLRYVLYQELPLYIYGKRLV
ncbi:MAG: GNAT family N-acetyltransferase [Candidatus Omnitrophica bacterium]|nr:GNAT family N-acetyltransferase [Candidatus Omnitrophota bacterium]